MTIRVLIADDHGVVAEGLRFIVAAQPDMEVVACVQDSREAVHRAQETRPDVVVIDHAMPRLNGAEATRLIIARSPETRVIILSMYSNGVHVRHALRAGASGYVVKKSAAKELVEAIRSVNEGERYLSRELLGEVIEQVAHEPGDRFEILSTRERQVLQLMAEGQPITVIAATLSLSPKTVETYRARMMEKLGIRDVAGLVRYAIQHGVTPLE